MKALRHAVVLLTLSITLSSIPVQAQDYPRRPVRMIVAVGAGGTGDVFARVLGDELFKRWGQPVVIENRPGAQSNIGARACAEAPPDGYTLCIMPGEPLAYNPHLFKKLPFDPAKDFEPITNLFFNFQALVVTPTQREDGRRTGRAVEGQGRTLSYTAPSLPLMIYLEKLKRERGADWVGVPFKGGGDTTNAILSGSTPIAFLGMQNFISHLRGGTMNGLAVDGAKRSPLFPDIPTLAELGYRGNLTRVYFALVAPAGTPKSIVDKIHADVAAIGSDPGFRQKQMIERAIEPDLQHARRVRALPGRRSCGLRPGGERCRARPAITRWSGPWLPLHAKGGEREAPRVLRHLDQNLGEAVGHIDHGVVTRRHVVDFQPAVFLSFS